MRQLQVQGSYTAAAAGAERLQDEHDVLASTL